MTKPLPPSDANAKLKLRRSDGRQPQTRAKTSAMEMVRGMAAAGASPQVLTLARALAVHTAAHLPAFNQLVVLYRQEVLERRGYKPSAYAGAALTGKKGKQREGATPGSGDPPFRPRQGVSDSYIGSHASLESESLNGTHDSPKESRGDPEAFGSLNSLPASGAADELARQTESRFPAQLSDEIQSPSRSSYLGLACPAKEGVPPGGGRRGEQRPTAQVGPSADGSRNQSHALSGLPLRARSSAPPPGVPRLRNPVRKLPPKKQPKKESTVGQFTEESLRREMLRSNAGCLRREDLRSWLRSWSISLELAEKILDRKLVHAARKVGFLPYAISERLQVVRLRAKAEVLAELELHGSVLYRAACKHGHAWTWESTFMLGAIRHCRICFEAKGLTVPAPKA